MKSSPFKKASQRPPFAIGKGRAVYAATWHAKPYEIWPLPKDQNRTYLCVIQGSKLPRGGPWVFNYAVRRSPCLLISGDVPRFALAETLRGPDLNPPFQRLGDLRLRLVLADESFWLDETGVIHTEYHPWGTIHRVDLRPKLPLQVTVTAALAATSGISVTIAVQAAPRLRRRGCLELHFGGLDVNTPGRHWPEYLRPHTAAYSWHVPRRVNVEDRLDLTAAGAQINNPQVAFGVAVAVTPTVTPTLVEPDEFRALEDAHNPRAAALRECIPGGTRAERRVRFRFPLGALPDEIQLVAWKTGDPAAPPLSVARGADYLSGTKDYFQELLRPCSIQTPDPVLNAAFDTALVNLDYGYEPPAWLEGLHEWNSYFCNNYQLSAAIALGQLDRVREALVYIGDHPEGPGGVLATDGTVETVANYAYDAVPYYLLQLTRYWRATADTATLRRVWAKTRRNFEALLAERDPDGDQLLNWHLSCNAFLYQSDHLSLPGVGASPSLMAIGMLHSMADLAEAVGEPAPAGPWRRRAAYMRRAVVRRLWLEKEGRFASGIDAQGLVQQAAYYTDYAFPILYAGLPDQYGRRSLAALDRDLWIDGQFLRTGSYRPDYFGNNAVHPTAMTESAEAYFAAGRADRGWALLHGCAWGATILTDSPGSFPEYCAMSGWGLPDAIFGNPAGSFLWAVIAGLFGFERSAADRSLAWHPCLPASWEQAQLTIDNVTIRASGTAKDRLYELAVPRPQALECRLPLFGRRLVSLTDDAGHPLPADCASRFAQVRLPSATAHQIRVRLAGMPRSDLAQPTAPSTTPLPPPKPPVWRPGTRIPVPLDDWFNCAEFPSPNLATPRLKFLDHLNAAGKLVVGATAFAVRPAGTNIVKIEAGQLNRQGSAFEPTDAPDAVVVPIDRAVAAVEFLFGSDCKCRLTGMEIGSIVLRYDRGSERRTPLVFGGNVDSLCLPFATQVTRRELACDEVVHSPESVAAFSVAADPRRRLREIEIKVFAADATLGLLAVNLVTPAKTKKP